VPGSIYLRNLRLARAYAEGSKGAPATNPHPANTPANAAYTDGALKVCATYAGVAECSVGVATLSQAAASSSGQSAGTTSAASGQPASDLGSPFGSYVVGASASVADGEVFVDSGKAYVNVLDNGGTDQATALMAFVVGDTLRVKAASDNNWWDVVLTAAPSKTGSIVTFTGTVTVHGTAPTTATATELRKKPAAAASPAPPADDTPDETWVKADIQQWLTDRSISYSSSATKAELLALLR